MGLIVEDSHTGELSTIEAQGIFPFIGLDPITEFVKDLGIVNEKGYIEVDDESGNSSCWYFCWWEM